MTYAHTAYTPLNLNLSGMDSSTLSPFFVIAGVAAAAVGLGLLAQKMGGAQSRLGRSMAKNAKLLFLCLKCGRARPRRFMRTLPNKWDPGGHGWVCLEGGCAVKHKRKKPA